MRLPKTRDGNNKMTESGYNEGAHKSGPGGALTPLALADPTVNGEIDMTQCATHSLRCQQYPRDFPGEVL